MKELEVFLEEVKMTNWQIIEPGLPVKWFVPDQLMKVIEEITELWEAVRKLKFATFRNLETLLLLIDNFNDPKDKHAFIGIYEQDFQGTIESELADCFISLLTLCTMTGRSISITPLTVINNPELLMSLIHKLSNSTTLDTDDVFSLLNSIATNNNIDIQRHITLKLEYNRIREDK